MIKEEKNIKINFLLWLIILSFISRIAVTYVYRDLDLYSINANEWNVLLQNLIQYKSYSLYIFNETPIPSVYMPPGYPFFLYFLNISKYLFDNSNLLYVIYFSQIILSTYSVYIFYQISNKFFSNNLSLVSSSIFSFFPINLYSCGQVSSINLQIFLSLLFLHLLLMIDNKNRRYIFFFSIVSGLLLLTRGEFILIFFFIILFGVVSRKIKLIDSVKILLIVAIVISPYVVRNYIHFNQVFLVKSLGYNLWKGNNEKMSIEGNEDYNFPLLRDQLDKIKKDKFYEINRDQIFLDEVKNNLLKEPKIFFNLFLKKILSFYFIDLNSSYPRYYNILNIAPTIIVAILSFFGLFNFVRNKNIRYRYFSLYLFSNLLIFSIFFILPRYKLIILPIQIIIAVHFSIYLLNKITSKKIEIK